jgi:hypothetical protein
VKRTSALKKFIRSEQAGIGTLKGGWAAAAAEFGVHPPAWITRHFSGYSIDQTDRKENPYCIARNSVPYMQAQDNDLRITANALKDRKVALERQVKFLADNPKKI